MKKTILIIALAFTGLTMNVAKAQSPNLWGYDTMIMFYHPDLVCCNVDDGDSCVLSDPKTDHKYIDNYWSALYSFREYDYVHGGWVAPPELWGSISGTNRATRPRCLAQPYAFDTAIITICGIYARVEGIVYNDPKQEDSSNYYWRILDENFNELGSRTVYPTWKIGGLKPNIINRGGFRGYALVDTVVFHSFYFNQPITSNSGVFYIAGDVPFWGSNEYLCYKRTRSIFDTVWTEPYQMPEAMRDTILGCQSSVHPYVLLNVNRRTEGASEDWQWTSFADDTTYRFFQNTFLELIPILLVNFSADNALSEADLDYMCRIFPNPAKDKLNIKSNFKVQTIEIYNALGSKVKEQSINDHMATIDINLSTGNYIVKLYTTQGTVTKKLVVK